MMMAVLHLNSFKESLLSSVDALKNIESGWAGLWLNLRYDCECELFFVQNVLPIQMNEC